MTYILIYGKKHIFNYLEVSMVLILLIFTIVYIEFITKLTKFKLILYIFL